MKKIAFQGEKGAFSEDAAIRFCGNSVQPIPKRTFRDVFESVISKQSEFGIVPIENSWTGSIHQNVDLLLEFNLFIIGEIVLRIQQNLLAVHGSRLDAIKKIFSHPQALEQCSNFLSQVKNVELIPMYDTAGSAQFISREKKIEYGSIASARAADDYHLQIIKKEIENDRQNFTRFLIIAASPKNPEKSGKTSIVFSTKDIPGALFKSLSVFALREINLLKIESRPLRKGPWKYWFYLDFEGSIQEESCKNAINHLNEITNFIKVLGSYPKGKVIG